MEYKSKKINFWHTASYSKEFKHLMDKQKAVYGDEIFNLNGIGNQLDINEMSKQFLNTKSTSDVSVDANANVSDKSVISLRIEMCKPMQLVNSYYRLWKELRKNRGMDYADRIIKSQLSGRIYINDFTGFSSSMPYCFNYSTYDTALMGIPAIFDGKGGSKAPKNLMSFLGQEELFSLIAGNSTLGATGLADLLIVVSIFMDKILKTGKDARFNVQLPKGDITRFIDKILSKLKNKISETDLSLVEEVLKDESNWETFDLTKEENCWNYLESILTGFVYRLNQPYRGSQSLFSNVSIYDKYFLENMLPSYVLEIDNEMYKADIDLVQKVQDIFLRIMNNELARKPLTFPVTTACFSVDDEGNTQDLDFVDYIARQNLKFGFINIYSGKSSTLSSCCRLRSEQDSEYFNSFGAGSSKIGSLGVATGNLPQLAYKVKEYTEKAFDGEFIKSENLLLDNFLDELKNLVIDCQEVNNAKRNIVNRTIKSGNHPIYSLGYMDIKKQYSTFGVIGLYEALEILGLDILTEEGQTFVLEIMDVINSTNKELQKRFKAPHNCEQIPGENVSVKLAKLDKLLKINDKYDLYSNQFIPLVKNVNMLDRITLQGKFDKHFSGGAIAHLNMDQEIKDVEVMKNLIISCAKQGVVYFAINYVLQECEKGHLSIGNVEECPICGNKIVSRYTRVVGFLTKVENWIKERRTLDFPNRQFYKGL